MRADDSSNFAEVIQVAERANKYEELVSYLQFARKTAREAIIESELLFAYAKTGRLADLEDFISSPNIAQVIFIIPNDFSNLSRSLSLVIDALMKRCMKLLKSYSLPSPIGLGSLLRLSICTSTSQPLTVPEKPILQSILLYKTPNINKYRVWKEVNAACVDNEEFKLAQICGLHLVIHAEELDVCWRFLRV